MGLCVSMLRPPEYDHTPAGLEDAEKQYGATLKAQREKYAADPGHPDLIKTMSILNKVLDERGKHVEAAGIRNEMRDALERRRQLTARRSKPGSKSKASK